MYDINFLISSYFFLNQCHYVGNNYKDTLQFRPSIPRRSSFSRFPLVNNFLVKSQTPNHQVQEKQPSQTKGRFDSEIDHDEGIDSAIESRSLSINTSDDGAAEVSSTKVLFLLS